MWVLQTYTVPETTGLQYAIALFALLGAFLLFAGLRFRAAYLGLPDENREHKAAITQALATVKPETRRFDAAAIRDGSADLEARIRELVDEDDPVEVPQTAREGVSELRAALRAALSDAVGDLPEQAIKAGEWALVLVTVTVPVVATAGIREAVGDSPGYPSLGAVVGEIVGFVVGIAEFGVDIVALFPAAEALQTLAVLVIIQLGGALFESWLVVVLSLVTAGACLVVLDRHGYDTDVSVISGRREGFIAVAGGLIVVWIAGVVPSLALAALGLGGIGAGLGTLLAVLVAGALLLIGSVEYRDRLLNAARDPLGDTDDVATWQLAAVVLSRVATILVWLAVPLTLSYAAAGLLSGDYVSILAAALTAPLDVQLALVLGIVLVVALLAMAFEEFGVTLRTVLVEVGTRKRLRAVALARGFPLVGAALAYLLFQAVLGGVVLPAVAALVIGLLARGTMGLLTKARYRARTFEEPDRTPRSVTVQVWAVRDADGTHRYVGDVGGERLAAPAADQLVDALCEAASQLADDGTQPTTLENAYHQALTEVGIVDWMQVVRAERERARKTMLQTLRNSDGFEIERTSFDQEVGDIARTARRDVRQLLERSQVVRVGTDRVAYRPGADPWRE